MEGDIGNNDTEFMAACEAAAILCIDLKAVINVYKQNVPTRRNVSLRPTHFPKLKILLFRIMGQF